MKQPKNPRATASTRPMISTVASSTVKRALYNNLGKTESLALAVDLAVQGSRQDWRGNPIKVKGKACH